MVSKINIRINPPDIIPGEEQNWAETSRQIHEIIDFQDFKADSPRSDKLIIYKHSRPLSFLTTFILLVHGSIKENLDYSETTKYPKFYLNFFSRYNVHCKSNSQNNDSYFNEFISGLKKRQANHLKFKLLDESVAKVFAQIFKNPHQMQSTLENLITQKESNIELTSKELFANMCDIHEYLGFALQAFKEDYKSTYSPELFKNKPVLKDLQKDRIDSIQQIAKIDKFLVQLQRFCTKNKSNPSLSDYIHELNQEFYVLIIPIINDLKNGKGIFSHNCPKSIHCFKSLYQKNIAEPNKTPFQIDPDFKHDSIPNIFLTELTIAEIGALATYLENQNRQVDLFMTLIFNPLQDLITSFNDFAKSTSSENSNKALSKVLASPKLPRFSNLYNDPTLSEILQNFDLLDKTRSTPPISPKSIENNEDDKEDISPIASPPLSPNISPQKRITLFNSKHHFSRHTLISLTDLHHIDRLTPFAQTMIGTNIAYRLAEQRLITQIHQETNTIVKDHNLFWLASKITSTETIEDILPFVKRLFAAHAWTEQPYTTYQTLKNSNRPIPPFLQQVIQSTIQHDSIHRLKFEILNSQPPIARNEESRIVKVCFDSAIHFDISNLLSKVNSESSPYALLKQFQLDFKVLNDLEELLSQGVSLNELPMVVKHMAKLQHALMQHLLQCVYSTQHYGNYLEHDLNKLISSINWKEPISDKLMADLRTMFFDIHRLSSYPFDANKVESPLHKLILQAEIFRSEPQFKKDQEQGFEIKDMTFGPLKVPMEAIEPQTILNISRSLMIQIIQKANAELINRL